MKATIKLFGAVESKETAQDAVFIEEYGILIAKEAVWAQEEIREYLKENELTGDNINSTFHKSWEKVKYSKLSTLIAEQIVHYFTTYGLESLGLGSKDLVYIPEEILETPERVAIKVIKGVRREELIEKALSLLCGLVALKQETIELVFLALEELNYEFTGEEEIKNREAKILLADKKGIYPKDGEDLFRYMFYKATGTSLVVNNETSRTIIQKSNYELPNLTEVQVIELSKGFNRHKKLWIAFKKANKANIRLVNRISKLSKKHHVPRPPGVLKSLTYKDHSPNTVMEASKKVSVFDLIRGINVLRLYAAEPSARYYQIRNGKGHPREKENSIDIDTLKLREDILIKILKQRLNSNKNIYCPPYVDYALPVSEKQFSSNIPKGTKVTLNKEEGTTFLSGIYWKEDYKTDLDLSALKADMKIGWDSQYRTEGREIMFSGDITTPGEDGAAEWIYQDSSQLEDPYLLTVNKFFSPLDSPKYQIMVAISTKHDIESNYICNPNEVILQVHSEMVQKEMLIGIVIPNEDNIDFYLIDRGCPGGNISSWGGKHEIIKKFLISSEKTRLRVSEVFNLVGDKDECEVDLSPNNIDKETFLSLLKE